MNAAADNCTQMKAKLGVKRTAAALIPIALRNDLAIDAAAAAEAD